MLTLGRFFRAGGALLLSLLVAVLGTAALVSPFERVNELPSLSQMILREEILNAVASFGLGYFVNRKWHQDSSKWTWSLGLIWFTQRAVRFWLAQRTSASVMYQGQTIYSEMSGSGCRFDAESCRDWALYTLQFLRTAFFSAGAFCCSRMGGAIPANELPRRKEAEDVNQL
jgi:K+-transporting ATPase A subunit